jgi:hypothetical protein
LAEEVSTANDISNHAMEPPLQTVDEMMPQTWELLVKRERMNPPLAGGAHTGCQRPTPGPANSPIGKPDVASEAAVAIARERNKNVGQSVARKKQGD